MKTNDSVSKNTDETSNPSHPPGLSRRQLMRAGGAAATAFTIVPRHVLGGAGFVAPSEKITLACVGFGTQAIREIGGILASPDVQVVAVCDVEKDGVNYLEWGKNDIRDGIRRLIENPTWREGSNHVPGGRDVGKEVVETYYAKQRGKEQYKGCATYADFRELLEKEKDVTAVKVMTPDHTHATISIAALKKGMNVIVHKPLANRLLEARAVIETARSNKIATHFMPASEGAGQKQAVDMIKNGAIGTLREIHNWSMRPMWPQFPTRPTDTPPVPAGFDWTLWLGPSLDRPYHPNYTHTNFRGWYEFGGGSIADMGHYSLWPIFQLLDLESPISVESTPSHVCTVSDDICLRIKNDYSFPAACTIRMRFAPKGERAALDIFWYDGGIKPPVPEELMAREQGNARRRHDVRRRQGKDPGRLPRRKPAVDSRSENARFSNGEQPARASPTPAPRRRPAGRRPVSAQRRMDHRLQRRPGELWRFPAGTPDLRRSQPGRDLTSARRPEASLGFRRGQDHQHLRGEPVPDA